MRGALTRRTSGFPRVFLPFVFFFFARAPVSLSLALSNLVMLGSVLQPRDLPWCNGRMTFMEFESRCDERKTSELLGDKNAFGV